MNHSTPQASTGERLHDQRLAHGRRRARKQTFEEIERTAEDLLFEAHILDTLAEVFEESRFKEIADEVGTLASRVMIVHDDYRY